MCTPAPSTPATPSELRVDYKEAYRYHSSTLRNWYVAFGIGAPVLLASNEHLWQKVARSSELEMIAGTFFLGVALQILLALLDKYASWIQYHEISTARPKIWQLSKLSKWWINDDTFSISLDLGSLALFGYAAFTTLSVIRQPPCP